MKIEGTALEIIAKVNNLTQVEDRVYADEKGNKFIISKFGFVPVTIWNQELLKKKHYDQVENLNDQIK
ncbi:MAG: hypothetical protein ACKO96_32900, partial [Flammeovirgaceae bacterium]